MFENASKVVVLGVELQKVSKGVWQGKTPTEEISLEREHLDLNAYVLVKAGNDDSFTDNCFAVTASAQSMQQLDVELTNSFRGLEERMNTYFYSNTYVEYSASKDLEFLGNTLTYSNYSWKAKLGCWDVLLHENASTGIWSGDLYVRNTNRVVYCGESVSLESLEDYFREYFRMLSRDAFILSGKVE